MRLITGTYGMFHLKLFKAAPYKSAIYRRRQYRGRVASEDLNDVSVEQ